MRLQAKWDAFDPATADGFAGWLPGFYDAVEAAADTESRWLQGMLPAQVITRLTNASHARHSWHGRKCWPCVARLLA